MRFAAIAALVYSPFCRRMRSSNVRMRRWRRRATMTDAAPLSMQLPRWRPLTIVGPKSKLPHQSLLPGLSCARSMPTATAQVVLSYPAHDRRASSRWRRARRAFPGPNAYLAWPRTLYAVRQQTL